ncbi:hypothetical protein [Mucilaginibacter glaciei]|uniref:Uncharacterized protein n=1 Tax=Mucilaginibacter glaciei TaxID=2772109 RepID=A0A926S1Q2_9SPHI|nr:hypothetical protein [Mucilaginibacter glaciei]MBD1394285.1 hypothetical protein [Mucilaginibacter glaciei]
MKASTKIILLAIVLFIITYGLLFYSPLFRWVYMAVQGGFITLLVITICKAIKEFKGGLKHD